MKILITHVYSEQNAGDAAILSVMLKQISNTFPHAKITCTTAEKTMASKHQIHSFLYLCLYSSKNNLIKIFKTLYILMTSTIWAYTYHYLGVKSYFILSKELKIVCRDFAETDLILPVGGGYINGKNDIKSLITLAIQLHTLKIGKLLKKKIILYPQSIGPFGNKLQMNLASNILKQTDAIIAREDETIALLKQMGIIKNIIYKSVDAAFIFNDSLKKSVIEKRTKKMIGVTVRNWLPEAQQTIFEKEVAAFCKYLIDKKHYQVFLIPQVTSPEHNDDDRIPSKRIKNILYDETNLILLEKSYTAAELKGIYKQMNFLIGTRMHSVIFALTENVPCIAIEYEHKTRGIMRDLKLENFVIKIEDVTAKKLIGLFNNLEKNRMLYLNTLTKSLIIYQHKAREAGKIVKDIYQSSK
ncbi:MAG: polysaccharide pyruvyl transferase family protein [Candidatus Levybacteria bacterium]|nr:polysaccharide pyruvyl transferase family protein [Candidatus Levybacteria bacterium]